MNSEVTKVCYLAISAILIGSFQVVCCGDDDCQSDMTRCADECVDTGSDEKNCGMCSKSCSPDSECIEGKCTCHDGLQECDSICTNTDWDKANCGECGLSCDSGQVCSLGYCEIFCDGEFSTNCEGKCTDVRYDPENCGECGLKCNDGDLCVEGICT